MPRSRHPASSVFLYSPLRLGEQRRGVFSDELGDDVELVEEHPVLNDPAVLEVQLRDTPDERVASGGRSVQAVAAVGAGG